MWVEVKRMSKGPGHPFYSRLDEILAQGGFDVYVEEFERSGFESALNTYRTGERDWELLAEYEGRPDLQRVMIPGYPPYAKRMLRDNGVWARALRQPNVSVVGERIERITPSGIVTADGAEHQLDVLVYCTGFRAWRFLDEIEVTGRGGAGRSRSVYSEAGAGET